MSGVGPASSRLSLQSITDDWHLRYAGWAGSITGYLVPGVAGA